MFNFRVKESPYFHVKVSECVGGSGAFARASGRLTPNAIALPFATTESNGGSVKVQEFMLAEIGDK